MDDHVAAVARRELETAPDAAERVAEGLLQETYELRCGDERYVLQFAGDDADEGSLARGLDCYHMLSDSAVPVPEPVTDSVREVDGRRYTLVERLPGDSGERDISPARTRNAGRVLAAVHAERPFETAGRLRFEAGAPVVDPYPDGDRHGRGRAAVADNARTLREAGLEAGGRAVADVGDRVVDALARSFDPVLCHGDCSPDNVLFDGDEVAGVLDFDRAHAGDPWWDVCQAATGFWMHDPAADRDVRAALYDGYREAGRLGAGFHEAEPAYRVATLAWTLAGMVALGELSDDERRFYDERLVEAVDRLR